MALFRKKTKKEHPSATISTTHATPSLAIEARTQEIGREMLNATLDNKGGFLSSQFWQDKSMDWAMKDEAFKVQLFRFVDAFPMLSTPAMVHDHLVDYLSQPGVTTPPGMSAGLKAAGFAKGVFSKTVASQITKTAQNFIAGTNADEAVPNLQKLWKQQTGFTVDLLGEACLSHDEVEAYQKRYLDLVGTLPDVVGGWKECPLIESDHLGPLPRTNVSIKISSLSERCDPIDCEGSIASIMDTLTPILELAGRKNVGITFDVEQFELKELTFELFRRCCEKFDFEASLAVQSYLKCGDEDAEQLIRWAKTTGRQIGVRLIKGAYWDYEVVHAEQMGWPAPVWPRKRLTDACFERMAARFVEEMPRKKDEGGVKLMLGSHNLRSIAWTLAQLEKHELPLNAIETQKLFGMGDELKAALVEKGLRVREYIPVGEMIPGMAYLVRRLLENTSNESWLRAGFNKDSDPELLFATPHVPPAGEPADLEADLPTSDPRRHKLSAAVEGVADSLPMENEPLRDFAIPENRENFAATVEKTEVARLGQEGAVTVATAEDAQQALTAADAAFPAWRDTPVRERVAMILRAAETMRRERDKLSAIMVREAGKTWREADADTCEAIDFCEFYAREAVQLFEPQRLGQFIGELNHQWYEPLGVVSVISPWNFPLAITAGMAVAALATGNTVLLKPSSQTRAIASELCKALHDAGVPRDVLHFLPSSGGTVGDVMVADPRVAMIAFTGSREVGLHIWQTAGNTPPDQPFLKRVVCEMGGKNATIIDSSADLDEAVVGVRAAAFGYCGQKCSACSRVIVLDDIHERFLERIVGATQALVIGDPANPATDFGPIIDASAATTIEKYIEIGKKEAKLELAMDVPAGLAQQVGMPYVAPHIFSEVTREHTIANEEIFGPVLAVIRAKSIEEALAIGNSVDYKLTGGIYTRKPTTIEIVREQLRVGNLYINQKITGALVGRQPFGGFGMSGGGTKAGGAEYLLHFVNPRCCSENTMRHGFAPGIG